MLKPVENPVNSVTHILQFATKGIFNIGGKGSVRLGLLLGARAYDAPQADAVRSRFH